MNLIELNNRLDKDMRLLEKNLDKYEKLLTEAEHIKSAYQSELNKFLQEIERVRNETATALIAADGLIKLQTEFNQYVSQADAVLQSKLVIMEKQNNTILHTLESKVGNKITELEETNKVELLRIIK
jgi:uncharacterized protein (DUF3084 family)